MTLTIFSINGFMGNMWLGPQAEVAAAVQRATGIWWQPIGYNSSSIPLNIGVSAGLAELQNQRNQHPGPYLVSAWSEGAVIATLYLKQQQAAGNTDCKGGVMYGNPYRAAGQWNPIAPAIGAVGDPGGAGVGGPANNWRTPSTIHHYCHGPNQPSYDGLPGVDQYTCCSTGLDGDIARIFYNFVFSNWTGAFEEIFVIAQDLVTKTGMTLYAAIQTAIEWIEFFASQTGPHTNYTSYAGAAYLTALAHTLL
jgi:hypothetical protein